MTLTRLQNPYPHWCFTASNGDCLRLVPERGGLLSGWCHAGVEQLYMDHGRLADPGKSVRGGVPVLFPICGNLPGNRLPLPQGDFSLPQHGFARDRTWSLAALDDAGGPQRREGVRMVLTSSPRTLALFPFPFRLDLEWWLEGNGLQARLRLQNPGSESLPFCAGLHPYFKVSDLAGVGFAGLPEQGLDQRSNQPCDLADALTGLAEGVDLLARPKGSVALLDRGAGRRLQLRLTPPFDLAVIWTDPPRPMVCLEPWTAPRGALLSGERRLSVPPGAEQLLQCSFVVDQLVS